MIVAFRVIAGGQHPDHTRISDFRRSHLDAFMDLFKQTVKLCQHAGLVNLGLVSIDGTKVQGNASKHKAMSYERMQKEEKRLKEEIAALLLRAETTDRAEDKRFGKGQREEDLPAELRRREGRLEKIRAAKHALEQQAKQTRVAELEAQAEGQESIAATHEDATERKRAATRAMKRREQAEEISNSIDDDDLPPAGGPTSQGLETHRTPATSEGAPRPKAQHNFTDSESRIQERGGEYLQGYNAQAVVDADSQVIVAQGVTNPRFREAKNTKIPREARNPTGLVEREHAAGQQPSRADARSSPGEHGGDARRRSGRCGVLENRERDIRRGTEHRSLHLSAAAEARDRPARR